jgi:hypothetical protein
MDFMSSEESDTDESGTTVYEVKSLSWQSQELKRRKKSLDKHHLDSLSDLTRRRLTARRDGEESVRGKPNYCPDWACKDI